MKLGSIFPKLSTRQYISIFKGSLDPFSYSTFPSAFPASVKKTSFVGHEDRKREAEITILCTKSERRAVGLLADVSLLRQLEVLRQTTYSHSQCFMAAQPTEDTSLYSLSSSPNCRIAMLHSRLRPRISPEIQLAQRLPCRVHLDDSCDDCWKTWGQRGSLS